MIFRKNYPKLDFGGVNGFFVESVVATIEVKSVLDSVAMHQAVSAAANLKRLEPSHARFATFGWFPPKPLSYVIAYSGPAKMATVREWEKKARRELNLDRDEWMPNHRLETAGHCLDGVAVLGMGAHFLCNSPLFPSSIDERARSFSWEGGRGALLFLFLALQNACMNIEGADLNSKPYLPGHGFNGTFFD
ncbi:hypothetical protein [Azohydromonas australica]|uniref:hypothetical protein n=1 Tax=Azohydromonas australica TaxID=364039 RepID=UPI0012EB9081|nr:hypothetical protein [Azohydromonas australica]